MILILTGAVQSGKTRFLAGILAGLDRERTGLSGFLSPAVYEGGRLIGYDLAVLGRKTPVPYIRRSGEPAWERIGPYFFLPEALEEARRTILESRPRDLLVVDEVGPLELGGGGVWNALEAVLATPGRCCLLVVRDSCVDALPGKLGVGSFRLFPVDEPSARASLVFEISRNVPLPRIASGREG